MFARVSVPMFLMKSFVVHLFRRRLGNLLHCIVPSAGAINFGTDYFEFVTHLALDEACQGQPVYQCALHRSKTEHGAASVPG